MKLDEVLLAVWAAPTTTKSDFARSNADMIGKAASEGLITTASIGGHTNTWRVTPKGLQRVFDKWRLD